jgi:hypothetical protein
VSIFHIAILMGALLSCSYGSWLARTGMKIIRSLRRVLAKAAEKIGKVVKDVGLEKGR